MAHSYDHWAAEMQIISSQAACRISDQDTSPMERLNEAIVRSEASLQELGLLVASSQSPTFNNVAIRNGLSRFTKRFATEFAQTQSLLQEYRSLSGSRGRDANIRIPQLTDKLASSNLPHWNDLWSIIKTFRGLTGLIEHRVNFPTPTGGQASEFVHFEANGGADWVRVSSVPERRLLRQIASASRYWYAPQSEMEAGG